MPPPEQMHDCDESLLQPLQSVENEEVREGKQLRAEALVAAAKKKVRRSIDFHQLLLSGSGSHMTNCSHTAF